MKLALSFLCCLLVSGCSSLSSVKQPKPMSLKNFLQEQELREKVVSRVLGKLQFRFQQGKESFSGSGRLVKFDSKSRLEVSDPMGRVRYWLLGDEEGALAYYQTEQKAYSAPDGGAPYFRRFFGVLLHWKEFQNLWLGVLPEKWRKDARGSYEIRDSQQKVSIHTSDELSQVLGVKIEQGKEVWDLQLSDFDACCSTNGKELQLAHSLTIKIPSQETEIGIEWEEVNVLEEAPNPAGFLRKLPKKTAIIKLK